MARGMFYELALCILFIVKFVYFMYDFGTDSLSIKGRSFTFNHRSLRTSFCLLSSETTSVLVCSSLAAVLFGQE